MERHNLNKFFDWLKKEYMHYYEALEDTDSLHDAVLSVSDSELTADDFRKYLLMAYRFHRRMYVSYICKYVLRDYDWWFNIQDDDMDMLTEDVVQADIQRELEDKLKQKRLHAFSEFVRTHYSPLEYRVFSMFRYENKPIEDIEKATGLSRSTIANLMNDMCEKYKKRKHGKKTKANNR